MYLIYSFSPECFYGYFGKNCEQRCNDKCDGCNNVNGVCDRGCQAGWKGDNCQQQCSYGFYGQNCEQRCDDRCTGCSNVNGTCDRGCNPGWKGDNCQKQCQDKKYGLNCSENCENCRDLRQCHYINGSCLNGCSSGFQGEKCTMECAFGFYGIGCLQECSSFCKISHTCHHVTGLCKDGCKNGWQGNNCFEISKVENTDTDWKSKFNGMLGAFCVLLVLTGCLVAYLLTLTRRNKKRRTNQHQHDVSTRQGRSQYCEDQAGETAGSGYHELSEYSTVPRTYQNLETY
uniref:Multiple epidermal growth factor-like domains protein 10 n=1 Tax=Crassostrea virginica TaxID=6565 RepID=A0A8B8BPU2_CRAVI|nr:multiple epidermal growth factor-like domains protein 10 [Crassostrea virginica]